MKPTDRQLIETYETLPAYVRGMLQTQYTINQHRIGTYDADGNTYDLAAFLADVIEDTPANEWRNTLILQAIQTADDLGEICTECPTHCGTERQYVTHDIRHVACVICGYETSDRDQIESWNNYGDHGEHHDTDATVWTYANGDRLTIVQTGDGSRDEYRHTQTAATR